MFIKSDAPEALELSIRAVRAYAVGMPFYGLNVIYQCYFQGIGRSRLSSVSGFLLEAGFIMLSAAVISFFYSSDFAWYAFPAAQLLMLIYYRCVMHFVARKQGAVRSELADRILLLPPDFDVPEEDRMYRSVTDITEVNRLSQDVWDFCSEHGCSDSKTYLVSLSVEEMVGNVIQHGFNRDKHKHSVDVRVIKKDEDIILRVRDDCTVFDPVKQLELYSEKDKKHHIGIRMIIRSAKSVQYTCVLKLNNLLVRV